MPQKRLKIEERVINADTVWACIRDNGNSEKLALVDFRTALGLKNKRSDFLEKRDELFKCLKELEKEGLIYIEGSEDNFRAVPVYLSSTDLEQVDSNLNYPASKTDPSNLAPKFTPVVSKPEHKKAPEPKARTKAPEVKQEPKSKKKKTKSYQEKELNRENVWACINEHEDGEQIRFNRFIDFLGMKRKKPNFKQKKSELAAVLKELEKDGLIAISGVERLSVWKQNTLPGEIDLQFNHPKLPGLGLSNAEVERHRANLVLSDRSILKQKAGKISFRPIKINLDPNMGFSEQRSISKANMFIMQDPKTGQYTAYLKEVIKENKNLGLDEDNGRFNISPTSDVPEYLQPELDRLGVPYKYSESAIKEAEDLVRNSLKPAEVLKQEQDRVDFRDFPFITIDAQGAKRRDDAFYVEEDSDPNNKNGHILWVAYPDIPHYIQPGTELDKEAQKRLNAVYFRKGSVQLFPEILIDELFSLNPHQDRLCNVYRLKINSAGQTVDRELFHGVMNSYMALNFDQANQVLEDPEQGGRIAELMNVDAIKALASNLEYDYKARGALTIPDYGDGESSRAIQLFTYTARHAAGKDQAELNSNTGLFLAQNTPHILHAKNEDVLREAGLEDLADDYSATRLKDAFASAVAADDIDTVKGVLKPILPNVQFTSNAESHFSIALDEYASITSPMLKYEDIVSMRVLKSVYGLKSGAMTHSDMQSLPELAVKFNAKMGQINAARAKIDEAVGVHFAQASSFNEFVNKARRNQAFQIPEDQSIEAAVIQHLGIPYEFSDETKAEIESIVATQSNPEELLEDPLRTDLTDIPFITIDGKDARDFDDAIYTEPDTDPNNPGGHICWVAIADVSHYVRPNTALDRTAIERGNSVYMPDMVVPMLPEELSNGLCSLKENEFRACEAYKIKIDAEGHILNYKWHQGVMKSRARLTYTQVTEGIEGRPDEKIAPIFEDRILSPLEAYNARCIERDERKAVRFNTKQLSAHIYEDGEQPEFSENEGTIANGIIEELMILANVCAAEDLSRFKKSGKIKNVPFRVHPDPAAANEEALEMLLALGVISQDEYKNGVDTSEDGMNDLVARAELCDDPALATDMIIRLQSRAEYSTDNIGHFALQLPKYTHFTSPIRRVMDLDVHRFLKAVHTDDWSHMPPDLMNAEPNRAASASKTERVADRASKMALEQYSMRFLRHLDGRELIAKIIGASEETGIRFALNDRYGAKKLQYEARIPLSALPYGDYVYDQSRSALVNKDQGHVFALGYTMKLRVNLSEHSEDAAPVFTLANPEELLPNEIWSKKVASNVNSPLKNGPKSA